MNIENRYNMNVNFSSQNEKNTKEEPNDLKNAVSRLRTSAMALNEDMKFDTIQEEFDMPDFNGKCLLYVENCKLQNGQYRASLRVSYKTPQKYALNMTLKSGTKQDILDYLGNEKNEGQIKTYIKILDEEAQK